MATVGIVVIDVLFAVALLLIVACLGYLVYVTIRERRELKSSAARAGVSTAGVRTAGKPLKSLRPSAAHRAVHRHVTS